MPSLSSLSSVAYVCIFIALCYGAYTDYKSRIIPNIVPLLILIFGIFTNVQLTYKLISCLAIVLALFLAKKTTKRSSGGGDIKLYISLSFALGIIDVCIILIIVTVLMLLYKKLFARTQTHFPACVFIAISYFAYYTVTIIVARGLLKL
jgi:Flp pilus assembly protein protease CpaA